MAAADYPKSLKLTQVQFIHRHGERSPLVEPFPKFFFGINGRQLCSKESILVSSTTDTESIRVLYEDRKLRENDACFPGQLTDKGKSTMSEIGARLRQTYIDRLGLLPSSLSQQPHILQVKSTEILRAIESAVSLLHGLYPNRDNSTPINIITRHEYNEHLYPNFRACPALKQELDKIRKQVSSDQKAAFQPILAQLQEKTETDPKMVAAHVYYDYLACAKGNNVPLPINIDDGLFDRLERMSVEHWWLPYKKDDLLIRLGIGRLLQEITNNMVQYNKNLTKMFLYSGHDSTIAPLLSALQLYQEDWPDFGSNIALERFERENNEKEVFVRVLYNFKPQELPWCQKAAKDANVGPDFCPLQSFRAALEKYFVENFQRECQLK